MGHNHAEVFSAVARALPERDCVVFRNRRLSYATVADRSTRLANVLVEHGITLRRERDGLKGCESGQDHVALYLFNGNEYLEGMLGSAMARAASFNVNYRYVEAELAHLLNDADTAAVLYHATFAPTLAAVLDQLDRRPLLLQVADESGHDLLPDALDYEEVLSHASAEAPGTKPSPEDLYVLYTGGTTGSPKGTLWRQSDIFDTTMAPLITAGGVDTSSLEALESSVRDSAERRALPAPPLMHGAGQWVALGMLLGGGTVVFPDVVTRFDPAAVLDAIERERVDLLVIVGDAFARPLCEELEHQRRDMSSLVVIATGGTAMSVGTKSRLHALLPTTLLFDTGGASETGPQLSNVSASGGEPTSGLFLPSPATVVLDEDRGRVLEAGHDGIGWLAHDGPIPLGYLHDEAKSNATFPLVDGRRMAVPGDRARLRADGLIELVGRESMTINSGGEKIFAEEVEQALMAHPDVLDVLVIGRRSERWGEEVVAVVQLATGSTATDDVLVSTATAHVARYKAPKAIVRVERVQRTASGKPDYPWAKRVAEAG
ncbi:MAG TPA: AMP-binding protein [Acidimicrobiales bacterium]|nr:AMP-binding protein [Acidimicrobiales bacterium]